MSVTSKQYDLEERTVTFGESTLLFCKSLQQDIITSPLINQLVRSATSIGANYMEANEGSSKRDFHKITFDNSGFNQIIGTCFLKIY